MSRSVPVSWARYLSRGVGPSKKYLVGGNWKANGTRASVAELCKILNDAPPTPNNVEVVCAPPFIHIPYAQATLRPDYAVSAQNVARETGYGAFTGELTPDMLTDFGLTWAITGHSERRAGFGGPGESSQLVAEKTKNGVDKGLSIIACVGELLSEREAGKTLEVVLEQQLTPIANLLTVADWAKVVIAYEPVWAIGTGVTASPEQAEEVHAAIRSWIASNVSADVARATRIIYGGSVKGSNAAELITKPNIDGFLVGGASLKPDFLTIIDACRA